MSRRSRAVAGIAAAARIRRIPLAWVSAAVLAVAGCQAGGDSWSSKGESTSARPRSATEDALVGPGAAPSNAMPAAPRPLKPVEVTDAASLRADAIAALELLSRHESPLIRAHAIESSLKAPELLEAAAARGLVDPNRGVRYAAVRTLGLALRCDSSHLAEPLLSDPSESVRAAAIAYLVRCGRPIDQSPLAAMLRSDNPEVRANAYVALGEIGNATAVPLIRSSLGQGFELVPANRVKIVELQAAEALAMLGEARDRDPIRAALFAPADQGEVTALACQIVGRLRDERSRPLLMRLVEADGDRARPPEIRLAALQSLGEIGGTDPNALCERIRSFSGWGDPSVRAQVAMALEASGSPQALGELAALFADENPVVKVAAAGAIVGLLGK